MVPHSGDPRPWSPGTDAAHARRDAVRTSAVVDKDLAAAMVADVLHADGLLLLTDVPAVLDRFDTPAPRPIRTMGSTGARAGVWETRTIGPKIEACCRFVQHTRRWAAIGALGDAARIVDGAVGTRIVGGDAALTYWDEDRGQR